MSEIDVETQGESVLQFLMSLPLDPDGTGVRVNGETRFKIVAVSTPPTESATSWTEDRIGRRAILIEKDIAGSITSSETEELEELQVGLRRFRRTFAPLPQREVRRRLEDLERKAQG